jgi:hypothetical protein
MAGRPAPATQVEIERIFRAARATGTSVRIFLRPDGYMIEASPTPENPAECGINPDQPKSDIVL